MSSLDPDWTVLTDKEKSIQGGCHGVSHPVSGRYIWLHTLTYAQLLDYVSWLLSYARDVLVCFPSAT